MKLLDILVQELPKRGGWPAGVNRISMFDSGFIYFDGKAAPGSFTLPFCSDGWRKGMNPAYTNNVTQEEYKLALPWVEWDAYGKENRPVLATTYVEVKLKDGDISEGEAGKFRWNHWPGCNYDRDIIAYRVIIDDDIQKWDGIGVPPVGTECEFHAQSGEWGSGTVLFVGEHRIFWRCHEDNMEYNCEIDPPEFRPLCENRETAIEKMLDVYFKAPPVTACPNEEDRIAMSHVYDAIASGMIRVGKPDKAE